MNASNCAALELCLCKTLLATSTHRCPACQKCVHAICGEICEDAGIQYHTTCFKCFATYKAAFKDPDDFRDRFDAMRVQNSSPAAKRLVAVIEHPQPEEEVLEADDDEEVKNLLESAIATGERQASSQGIEQLDLYKAVVNDSAMAKAEKIKKRRDFIRKLALSQCVVELDGTTSVLVSIAGIPYSKLLLNDLMLFCSTHKISGYRQKKKDEVSLLIAARVASDNIYASIGRLGMTRNAECSNTPVGAATLNATAKKQRSYRSKLVRPKAVTKTGSYFRAISLWFSPQNRHLVLLTGKKMNRTELDVGGYRHKAIWDNLAEQFNKNTGVPEDGDAEENAYLDVIQSPHHLYDNENPEDFDQLDGQDVSQFIRWITHQYYVVHKSVSGDHARFEDKVGEKGYLLYFHNMIATTGAENLESLMKAQLSHAVFAESSINGSADITTATTIEGSPCPTKKRKSKGPPSSTKEKTDEAILRFILNDNDEHLRITTLSPSTTTTAITNNSKDEYIREKKRIAVRADEVAMAREISDAVDFNLQKWKMCLKELRDMEKDGIAVNHPVFLATKATAKLHEASFNASLATATKAQATNAELVDTPINAAVQFPNTMSAVAASRNDIDSYHDDNDEQQLCTKTTSCGSSCSSSST